MMEDFRSQLPETNESKFSNMAMAELMDNSNKSRLNLDFTKLEIKAIFALAGPGSRKETAEHLDTELKDFAKQKFPNSSKEMQDFQGLVDKFNQASNKREAAKEFGDAASKLRVNKTKDAQNTGLELEKEIAGIPGRKALEADHSNKVDSMFRQINKLPVKEQEPVLKLMQWQGDESGDARASRVRAGLSNRPALLKSFNEADSVRERIEETRTAREKDLQKEFERDTSELERFREVTRKITLRSQIDLPEQKAALASMENSIEAQEEEALGDLSADLASELFKDASSAASGKTYEQYLAAKVENQNYYLHVSAKLSVDEMGVPKPVELGNGPVSVVPAMDEGAFREIQLAPLMKKALENEGEESSAQVKFALANKEHLSGKLSITLRRERIVPGDH